jgi:hypothetical protein
MGEWEKGEKDLKRHNKKGGRRYKLGEKKNNRRK